MTAALSLRGITCTFISRDDRSQRYTAVRDVSLDIAAGEFVSVVGPTGCGKSTLLNVAAGLLEPSAGSVQVFGQPLAGINARAGYMFQTEALMPWPDIILMDEPFSALDIQTRQLMENEVLELWAAKRKAVLFITHDLDEAIAMSDRVVVLSAGPAARPIGEFAIDLVRPRDVAEVRVTPRFIDLHKAIWDVLREEVLKGYEQQKRAA